MTKIQKLKEQLRIAKELLKQWADDPNMFADVKLESKRALVLIENLEK